METKNYINSENTWRSIKRRLKACMQMMIHNRGFNGCLHELSEALKVEEIFWKQNSRVLWLLERNIKSKFFHVIT